MYALTCECGQTIHVTLRQAGNEIVCPACDRPLKVPKLGELRKLPVVASPSDEESVRVPISMGRRIAFAGFCLVAGIGLFIGAFSLISAATIEVESTTEEHIASDIERIQNTPPAQVTELWREYMIYGLNDRHPFPYKLRADEKAAWTKRGTIALTVAGLAAVVAFFLARSGKEKGTRTKETAVG